jgi:anthranilate phosphoribosyltransferase
LDELTTTGPSQVAELKRGAIRSFEVTPEDAGLPYAKLADLKGGDAATNANAIRALLDGRKGPYRDIVVLNAAAALVVAEAATDLQAGADLAAEAVDSGAARALLDRLVATTHAGVAARGGSRA